VSAPFSCSRVALLVASSISFALPACGDDASPRAVSTIDRDGGDDAGLDADAMMPLDADVVRPPDPSMFDADIIRPIQDAGRDALIDQPPDDDADVTFCRQDCAALATECRNAYCDLNSLECKTEPKADGLACGSQQLSTCTAPDTCQDGVCEPRHQAKDTPCGDQGHECRFDDACDGQGRCVDNGLRPVDTACGDARASECDGADTCNAHGVCAANHAEQDAPCGDQGVACRYDDACDGNGTCIDQGSWPPDSCPAGVEP
jgi:hypothetical protein